MRNGREPVSPALSTSVQAMPTLVQLDRDGDHHGHKYFFWLRLLTRHLQPKGSS